ncbi:uncharacterized protein [Argopecten irradians]|uniref:uncharacterized protein n=1 Tax=Argopecten irradians TaxID=31199 RepID=UPI0037103DBE
MAVLRLFTFIALVAYVTSTLPCVVRLTETVRIDTSCSCNREGYRSPPTCSIDSLNWKIRNAERQLTHAIDAFLTPIAGQLDCSGQHRLALVSSDTSDLISSLQNGIQMLTQVALNISLSNCSSTGQCSSAVHQTLGDVICEMKRMLMFVDYDVNIFSATMTHALMEDRTDRGLFTCASLETGREVLRFLEMDINRIFRELQ